MYLLYIADINKYHEFKIMHSFGTYATIDAFIYNEY